MTRNNHSGGSLRIKLSPAVARALGRTRPGWFIVRIGPEIRERLEAEAARREDLAGLPAGSVPLGQLAAQLLEAAWGSGRIRTLATAAAMVRAVLAESLPD